MWASHFINWFYHPRDAFKYYGKMGCEMEIQIISYIIDTLNLDVLLLAHVIHVSDSNDKIIIDELMKRLDHQYHSRVHVVDHLIQPYEARILLGGGKATITGRMHAAVSSINMGTVPMGIIGNVIRQL